MRILSVLKLISNLDLGSKKEYKINNEWSILLPEKFEEEPKRNRGEYIFHSKYGYLTFKVASSSIYKGEEPESAEMMSNIFYGKVREFENLKENKSREREIKKFLEQEFLVKCYDYSYRHYENNNKIYKTSCAIITDGNMIEINIESEYRMDIEDSIKYIHTVKKI